jgi:hypothetical protein
MPPFLDGIGIGYKMYHDHFTVLTEETILFDRPPVG